MLGCGSFFFLFRSRGEVLLKVSLVGGCVGHVGLWGGG